MLLAVLSNWRGLFQRARAKAVVRFAAGDSPAMLRVLIFATLALTLVGPCVLLASITQAEGFRTLPILIYMAAFIFAVAIGVALQVRSRGREMVAPGSVPVMLGLGLLIAATDVFLPGATIYATK
jgi:hypothetical protein